MSKKKTKCLACENCRSIVEYSNLLDHVINNFGDYEKIDIMEIAENLLKAYKHNMTDYYLLEGAYLSLKERVKKLDYGVAS
jgi:hypothetical protein